jgi:hypothetical protein
MAMIGRKFLRTGALAGTVLAGAGLPEDDAKEEKQTNGSQSWPQQFVKFLSSRIWLTVAACVCVALVTGNASAQLAPNQTNGFGNNRLVTFTYLENFDCVDEPTMDLDFNGIKAQSDQ